METLNVFAKRERSYSDSNPKMGNYASTQVQHASTDLYGWLAPVWRLQRDSAQTQAILRVEEDFESRGLPAGACKGPQAEVVFMTGYKFHPERAASWRRSSRPSTIRNALDPRVGTWLIMRGSQRHHPEMHIKRMSSPEFHHSRVSTSGKAVFSGPRSR